LARIRLLVLALTGFLVPVSLALLLAPLVFQESYQDTENYSRARFGEDVQEEAHALLPGSIDPDSSFVVVPTASELDPADGKTFVVSFLLRFNRFPPIGKRNKIVFKYAAAVTPYPGWAIAWRNVSTSLRPEVYWQDAEGVGGWFSFDDVPLKLDTWYSVTLFAKPKDYLSLYVGEYHEAPQLHPDSSSTLEESGEEAPPKARITYAGGYSLEDVGTAFTQDSLHIRAGDSAASDISVDVSEVIVGYSSAEPRSIKATKSLLAAGSDSVLKYLGEQGLSLWLDSEGKDRSSFNRPVISSSS